MRSSSALHWSPVLAVLAVTLFGTALHAQTRTGASGEATGFNSTGWNVQCQNTSGGLQCAAAMNVVAGAENQRVFGISLQEGAGEAGPTLVMQLPFGLNLQRGVDLRIDDLETETFTISTCLQTGCFVVQQAEQALINQMVAGQVLHVAMQTSDGNETTMDLPLEGFAAAIDRLN